VGYDVGGSAVGTGGPAPTPATTGTSTTGARSIQPTPATPSPTPDHPVDSEPPTGPTGEALDHLSKLVRM